MAAATAAAMAGEASSPPAALAAAAVADPQVKEAADAGAGDEVTAGEVTAEVSAG